MTLVKLERKERDREREKTRDKPAMGEKVCNEGGCNVNAFDKISLRWYLRDKDLNAAPKRGSRAEEEDRRRN